MGNSLLMASRRSALKFCSEYYPALGRKTIILQGWDANMDPFKDADKVKVKLKAGGFTSTNIEVAPADPSLACPESTATNPCAVFKMDAFSNSSIVRFTVKTNDDFQGDYVNLEFEIINPDATQLINQNYYLANSAHVSFRVRNNANVTLGQVLKGEAVFVNDCERIP